MQRKLGNCPLLACLFTFSYDALLWQLSEAINTRLYDLLLPHFNTLVALIQIQAVSTLRGVLLVVSLLRCLVIFVLYLAVVRRRFWVNDMNSTGLVAHRLRKAHQLLDRGYLLG